LSPPALSPQSLIPHLERCGYGEGLLAQPYDFGPGSVPVAGFASSLHDLRSACIAVIGAGQAPEDDVLSVRPLGAPIILACHGDSLQWWKQTTGRAELQEAPIPRKNIEQFFDAHKEDFSPRNVFEGKTLRRLPDRQQLTFVDAGLMPFVEREAGAKLSGLVEATLRDIARTLDRKIEKPTDVHNAIKATFWLLAAKVLRDKQVPEFETLDVTDIEDVFARVGRHYAVADDVPPNGTKWQQATQNAADRIGGFPSVRNLSTESLAHVYENAMVTREVRKEYGTHSTPSALVDYIVWQLWPWIEELPAERRHVFEPACGHGAFLLGALRVLRQWSGINDDKERHAYLKKHLHGIEIDSFALEVARLSLTLADVPHPNGWSLTQIDMFAGESLETGAAKCGVMLANPPYEPITGDQRLAYESQGTEFKSTTKATEVLRRTLPYLSNGACFGVVVPQTVLRTNRIVERELRELLLSKFELQEISLFGDKFFEKGEHEVAVILGRRRSSKSLRIPFRRVRNEGLDAFKDSLKFSSEEIVSTTRFAETENSELWVPELDAVWQYLKSAPRVGDMADVGQGFSFESKGLVALARRSGATSARDSIPAIIDGHSTTNIWERPPTIILSPSRTPVGAWRSGRDTGEPQILVNYVRAMRGPWRIKAIYDPDGHAVINTYSTVRTHADGPPALYMWALLNSPVANAFAFSETMKKHIYDTLVAAIPVPYSWRDSMSSVMTAAKAFIDIAKESDGFRLRSSNEAAIRDALLAMDAAVLQAYDLPPHLERQVLDLFQGVERKGVGCAFTGYYPPGFTSYLPLHHIISQRFADARADRVIERFQPGKSEYVASVLEAASEAFAEE